MKAVNVDDVLKILHKYGEFIFVTDNKRYSNMVDEIANLKALDQQSEDCKVCIFSRPSDVDFEKEIKRALHETLKELDEAEGK